MRILGISSQFHDASATVVQDGHILFAGHSERYSREKNDRFLDHNMIAEALSHGTPDVVVLHEKNWAKQLRHIMAGDLNSFREPSAKQWIKKFYPELAGIPIKSYWHHQTHAAAGVLTSNFDECAVMVIDAIGEFDCSSIWHWKNGKLAKLKSKKFPHSLGLFYSAVTAHVGLKPMEDEYILMGMAAYGDPTRSELIAMNMEALYFKSELDMKINLQRGLPTTRSPFWSCRNMQEKFDLALAAQYVMENKLHTWAAEALHLTKSTNLVYMGGCALNCVANNLLHEFFDNVHIMPNPGDAGSSLGAAAMHFYDETGKKVFWDTPYLGTEIKGDYPVNKALDSLDKNEIFGIANGRAEFGPRALGNRSLMADPRGGEIKDRMNEIKRRQAFRPFAPVILEEYAADYFEMPVVQSPYMQFVAKCKYPDKFPAIIHADGTSRVQTVNVAQHRGLHKLLTEFHAKTGCPMLVNTSLNIKGQPIVNDEYHANDFAEHYGVPVHTSD